MTRIAAKLLFRVGLIMLVLCIACRFVIQTEVGMMGDNLAIIASLVLAVVALIYLKFAPRDDTDRARTGKARK